MFLPATGVHPWLDTALPLLALLALLLVAGMALHLRGLRRAQRLAQAERERLQAVIDSMDAFVATLLPDGTVLSCNQAPLRAAGLQPEHVVGRKFWDCDWWTHDEAVRERLRLACVAAAAGQTVAYAETIRIAGNGRAQIEFKLQPLLHQGRVTLLVPSAVDVSARVQAEQALRDSEARARESLDDLQALLTALPVAVWVARDAESRHVLANPQAHRLMGTSDPFDAATNISASGPPEARQRRRFIELRQGMPVPSSELPLQQAVRSGRTIELDELSFVFEDGEVRHLLGSARPLFDAAGRQRGGVAAFIDISEFKRAQEALQLRDRQLRSLADNSPDVLMRFDREHRHVFVNAAITRVTGRTPAEVIGRTSEELGLPPQLCRLWRRQVAAVFETGQPQALEFTFDGPQGKRHYRSRLVPERNVEGDVVQVLAVTTDVTETRDARQVATAAVAQAEARAEEAEASQRLLDGIMEHTPEGLVVARPGGIGQIDVRLVSRYARELIGQPPGALLGNSAQALQHWRLRQRDGQPLKPGDFPLLRAIRRGELIVGEELQLQDAHGAWVPVLCSAGPIRDEAGRVVAGVWAWRDIHALKKVEADLRHADRRKDEFLATLAHELRNPLAPLRNALHLLTHGADTAQQQRLHAMMSRQLAQMVRLIDDLLDVSRISSDKVVLRMERLDLRQVAEAALESARPSIEAAGHALRLALPDAPVWVSGDLTRLAQVASNLLTNAAKYTPEGGQLQLAVASENGRARLSVQDNGLGIPAEMLVEVFGMFTQVNRTLHRAQGGLGIGLALVKKLVQMHGGEVSASSPGNGRGSCFTVTLPLAEAVAWSVPAVAAPPLPAPWPSSSPPAAAAAPRAAAPPAPAGQQRVLVIDDNRDAAESLAVLLGLFGHQARTAYSGLDGLTAAAEFDPDWVLLDIGLPDISGLEVARLLAAEPQLARATRVALSGWGSDADRQATLAAGCSHHLTKPVDPVALQALLQKRSCPA